VSATGAADVINRGDAPRAVACNRGRCRHQPGACTAYPASWRLSRWRGSPSSG